MSSRTADDGFRPVVLVALGDPFQLELVTEACQAAGWSVIAAADGEAALGALSRRIPAVLVAGADLPGIDGHELVKIVREDSTLEGIALVLLGSEEEALADAVLPARPRVDRLQSTLADTLAAARDRRRENRADSQPATPGDRAQLLLTLSYEMTEAERTSRPLGCLVLHAEAEPLNDLIPVVLETVRSSDMVFRTSAVEVVVLLPETDAVGVKTLLERLSPGVTPARIGHATFPAPGVRDLLASARDKSA